MTLPLAGRGGGFTGISKLGDGDTHADAVYSGPGGPGSDSPGGGTSRYVAA